MLEATLNNTDHKSAVRCTECDREMTHYITWTDSGNNEKNVCWECVDRQEKGFNTKRGWQRSPRTEHINAVQNSAKIL